MMVQTERDGTVLVLGALVVAVLIMLPLYALMIALPSAMVLFRRRRGSWIFFAVVAALAATMLVVIANSTVVIS